MSIYLGWRLHHWQRRKIWKDFFSCKPGHEANIRNFVKDLIDDNDHDGHVDDHDCNMRKNTSLPSFSSDWVFSSLQLSRLQKSNNQFVTKLNFWNINIASIKLISHFDSVFVWTHFHFLIGDSFVCVNVVFADPSNSLSDCYCINTGPLADRSQLPRDRQTIGEEIFSLCSIFGTNIL